MATLRYGVDDGVAVTSDCGNGVTVLESATSAGDSDMGLGVRSDDPGDGATGLEGATLASQI